MASKNIHPIFEHMLSREEREERLGQRARVVWLTGLSGSGKSTIAVRLERWLFHDGYFPQLLDGDNLRDGLNQKLGFSIEDRTENNRRVAEVAKLYVNSGIITICSFISPTREMRQLARDIIGEDDYLEVYVKASLDEVEARDVKGLYAKARAGEIKGFTGIDSPFEEPENPTLVVDTETMTPDESAEYVLEQLLPYFQLGK